MLIAHEHLVRELIRLIVDENDGEKRKALSEKLEQVLNQERKAFTSPTSKTELPEQLHSTPRQR